MPDTRVVLLTPKSGVERAQVKVGAAAGKAHALSAFPELVRTALAGKAPETWLSCTCTDKDQPGTVRVVEGAQAQVPVPKTSPPPTAHAPKHQGADHGPPAGTRHTIASLHDDKARVEPAYTVGQGPPRDRVPFENMGVSDRLLAVRPGAELRRAGNRFVLDRYAPAVRPGLGDEPSVDRNPYNFVEPHGDAPWRAEDAGRAKHDRDQAGRHTGVITLTIEAVTPVLVPDSNAGDEDPRTPWSCRHPDGTERYALPGSSMKGAVRTLFEALTNSRMGVTDEEALGIPPLYRRRASHLFVVETLPGPSGAGTVVECRFEFLAGPTGPVVAVPHRATQLSPADLARARTAPWRANLFHVDSTLHRHRDGKSWLAWLPAKNGFRLTPSTFDSWRSMRGHPHFRAHPDNVAQNPSTSCYRDAAGGKTAPPYDTVAAALFDLAPGDLVFGITRGQDLVCFGKNVSFLWPAERTPRELLGAFAARTPAGATLADSDAAEASFGFIGEGENGHAFRGRVRFTPFWADAGVEPAPPVALMPLTSPGGARGKARPLYLDPAPGGRSSAHAEVRRGRGRKMYWHQKADGAFERDGIPGQHRADVLRLPHGPVVPQGQQQPPLRPLPAGTGFHGEVHFSNLSDAELGALLVALDPSQAFGAADDGALRHGIRIGKGKPRGLGSVVTRRVTLRIDRAAPERYARLDADVTRDASPAPFVAAWQDRVSKLAGRHWASVPFVQDLEHLLRLPINASVRVYPPRFSDYGWLPGFDDAAGDPDGGRLNRPPAMRRARDLDP